MDFVEICSLDINLDVCQEIFSFLTTYEVVETQNLRTLEKIKSSVIVELKFLVVTYFKKMSLLKGLLLLFNGTTIILCIIFQV